MHEKHIHTYNIHTDIALNTCVQAYAPMQLVTWTRKASNATTAADFMSAQTLKPTIPTYLCIHTGVYSRISIHVNTKPCVSLVRYVYIYIKINGIYISKSISISICVYIYMKIYTCICTYQWGLACICWRTYLHINIHTSIQPSIHPFMHTYTQHTYMHAYTYTCTVTYTDTVHIHKTYTCVHMHTYIHTYVRTYIHSCHPCIHTHACKPTSVHASFKLLPVCPQRASICLIVGQVFVLEV